MNINNFEKLIEPKIIARGFDYYEQEHIRSFEQMEEGEFSAIIIGTDTYSIFVKLDTDKGIVDHSCTCPYDWGEYCKHKVAVLYRIKDGKGHLQEPETDNNFSILKDEIENCDSRKFKDLILYMAKRDRKFRSELFWEFGHEDDYPMEEEYF